MKRILSLWLTVAIVLVPWVAFGQESAPPPADPLEPVLAFAEKYPELTAVLISAVVWPAITGLASLGYHKLEERFPVIVAYLRAAGLDLPRALNAIRAAWPKRLPKLPPPAGPAILLLVVVLGGVQAGCGAQEKLSRVVEAGRDVAVKAEPCFVAMQSVDVAACREDAACVAKVKESWAPIADALDVLHGFWCATAPDSDGCK